MRIYILYRGPFGEQIINNLAVKGFGEKIINAWELKPEIIEEEHTSEGNLWTNIWENPEEYVPKNLPINECDLLLVLGIHSKIGDLIPPIAKRLKAKAVLYPVCDRDMAPEAKKTIEDELKSAGIHIEFPEPFCILKASENPFIQEFIKKFGRPKFEIKLDKEKKVIADVKVVRDTPGGSAYMVGQKLIGFPYNDREVFLNMIYEEHHNEGAECYCMAEMDPHYPLMQEGGDFLKDAIFEACGFETIKEAIVKKISELGEVDKEELKNILVDEPGNWSNPEKTCDADRTFYAYLEELIKAGKVKQIKENKLKLE